MSHSQKVESALVAIADAWRGDPSLPKPLVAYLVELFPAMDAASYSYPDERGDRIREAASELQELVYDVVNS